MKAIEFSLETEGKRFTVPDTLAQKLFAALGVRKAFNSPLKIECGAGSLIFGENGINARVERMLDYGAEKFVKCRVGEKFVYLLADKDYEGEVSIVPDLDKIGIIEAERNIRII